MKFTIFKTDRAVVAFVDKADLSKYDHSGAQRVRFEIKRKDKSMNKGNPRRWLDR
jgi:hypothetical protein